MSRIGKTPVPIPTSVEIGIDGANIEDSALKFTGIDPYHPLRVARSEKIVFQNMFKLVREAMKSNGCKRAILVGESTYGKGSVQSIIPLKNDGAIRLTVSKYYLPSGKSISDVGVTPDIVVIENSEDFKLDTKTDNQLNYALKLLNG